MFPHTIPPLPTSQPIPQSNIAIYFHVFHVAVHVSLSKWNSVIAFSSIAFSVQASLEKIDQLAFTSDVKE